ncbi:hypothetical protein ACQPT2_06590 [Erwinia amylovora]
MIWVDNMAAFLAAWQNSEACGWASQPGSELFYLPEPSPTLTLRILPGSLRDALLRQVLTWRFQNPDRYDGCYISMDAEGALSLMLQPSPNDDPHEAINTLYSLADLN